MNNTITVSREPLEWSLFGLRLGVFLVLFVWVLDKFLNPGHTAAVFQAFYAVSDLSTTITYLLGVVQGLIVLSFLVGFQKRWATLLILLMHFLSTVTPMARYFNPFEGANLLFFAAWPMLAAIVALYLLREFDTKFSLGK
ncbi:hypothetical protein CBF23_008510 [Marinomonas agarivorans]|nr:hypothetical protein CBF23_008510 [Marinomonas agarivorans]